MKHRSLTKRRAADLAIKAVSAASSVVGIFFLAWILFEVVSEGISVFHPAFFTKLPTPPGIEGGGMANAIISADMVDHDFVDNYAFGYEDWTDETGAERKGFRSLVLDNYDLATVAAITGVPAGTIARLAGEFASNRPAVALVPCKGGLLNGSVFCAINPNPCSPA